MAAVSNAIFWCDLPNGGCYKLNMTPDNELLRRYAQTRSEEAFAELVRRHVNLVYSAALRQVNGDAHLAKDVSQAVFADLARKAGLLARRDSLTGWLYTSAHFAAAKIVRTENRRRGREARFMRETTNESRAGVSPAHSLAETDWEKIRPALDDVMHELNEPDREAILLRFFENRQFAEVGLKLGLNENAARMRVERALEKLRAIFARRGIATAAALASVISANAVQTAPSGLMAALTASSAAAAGTGSILTLSKLMTTTYLKIGISTLVVAGAATAMVVQHQTQTHLRDANMSLHRQIAQLETGNQSLSNRLASIGQAKSLTAGQLNDLMRLRSEVGLFNEQTNQLAKELTVLKRENRGLWFQINHLQQQVVEKFPALTNVVAFKEHLIALFNAGKFIGLTMRMYDGDHGGVYPTNFEQITRYLDGTTNFPAFSNAPGVPTSNSNSPGGIRLDDFELVNTGLAREWFPDMPILRERQPLWWDGKWERVYVLADGSIKLATSESADFSAWEKKQLALALGTTNQSR